MARPSNCVTDLMLCMLHLVYALRWMRLSAKMSSACQMRLLATSYTLVTCSFQALGAWCHLFNPIPSEPNFCFYVYLMLGAACPCLYGCAMSFDIKPSRPATMRCFLVFGVAWCLYGALAFANIDFADHLPLPRSQEVTLSAAVVEWLPARPPWLPRVQAASGGKGQSITLKWDGRGYAATPFEHAFDADQTYASLFDLLAPHPCWKAGSFPFLFLIFGFGLNCVFLAKSFNAYRQTFTDTQGFQLEGSEASNLGRRRRFLRWFVAHCITTAGILSMPVAMLFSGVAGGIDWMHCVMAVAMYLQCCSLEEAVVSSIDGGKKTL